MMLTASPLSEVIFIFLPHKCPDGPGSLPQRASRVKLRAVGLLAEIFLSNVLTKSLEMDQVDGLSALVEGGWDAGA